MEQNCQEETLVQALLDFLELLLNLLHCTPPASGPERFLGEPTIFTSKYFRRPDACKLCAKFLGGLTGDVVVLVSCAGFVT